MKKLLALLMVLAMVMSFAACAGTDNTTPPSSSTPGTSSTGTSQPEGSKVMTHAEYMAAEEDAAVVVECYVQATQSWYQDAIVVYAQDKEGGYFAYNMACSKEDAAKLVPGTKICITGYKTFYKGMPEIAAGATFTFVEGADTYVAEPTDMTALLGSNDLVNKAGMLASFKNLTISKISYKNDEPGDDIYVDVTSGNATFSFCVERYLTDPDTDVYKAFAELKVGDVVNMEGFVYWYDGINTHITSVTPVA